MPTNGNISPTKTARSKEQLNDIGFRLILIPAFGIAIPLITGMINGKNFSHWEVKMSFLYTIAIAFIVWQGNRYLFFTLRAYFDWFNKPLKKIITLLLAISFYTIPISGVLLVGWYHIFSDGKVDWSVVVTSTLIIMICVIFITHVYETVFLVKDTESEMLRSEQLERARAEAELEALKNQIDPHFIFNSLNTLSYLIEERPSKAKKFNDNLAEVYRYILQNKARELVLLREEMEFLKSYFILLKIRFEKAIELHSNISDTTLDHYLIPPISLQILAENAIKHNEFSDKEPLQITVEQAGDHLQISNSIKKKNLRKPSSRIGLQNLTERYRLITGKDIEIRQDEHEFFVRLPILKIN